MDLRKALSLDETFTAPGEWNEIPFEVTAVKSFITPEFHQMIFDIDTKPIAMAESLSKALTSWTIDLGGQPFPPTFNNLKIVPKEFLVYVINLLCEEYTGNEEGKKKSASTSDPSAE